MKNIDDDRKFELETVIDKIVKDSYNDAISKCHHIILSKYDQAKDDENKATFSELESLIVELYKR